MDIVRFLKGEVFSKEAIKYLTELLIALGGVGWDGIEQRVVGQKVI